MRYHVSGDVFLGKAVTHSLEAMTYIATELAPARLNRDELEVTLKQLTTGDMLSVTNVGVIICVNAPWDEIAERPKSRGMPVPVTSTGFESKGEPGYMPPIGAPIHDDD